MKVSLFSRYTCFTLCLLITLVSLFYVNDDYDSWPLLLPLKHQIPYAVA